MANQSAAFGTVIISTKNKEDLKDFVYLQFLSERGANYPITLADFYGYTRVDKEEMFNTLEKSIDYIDNKYQVLLEVEGVGCWAFRRNVEWFFERPLTEDYKDKTINEIRDRLQNRTFQAIFEVIDAEAGSDYIAEAIYKIESVNTTPLFTIIKEDFYDYNAENLMYFDYYDIAVDKEYALKYLDELKNEIKKHNGPKELLENDDKLRKVISQLDDTIHCDYISFIDEIIERFFNYDNI